MYVFLTCGVCISQQKQGWDIVAHKFRNCRGPAPSGNIDRPRTRYQLNPRINTEPFDDCRIKDSILDYSRVENGRYLLDLKSLVSLTCYFRLLIKLVKM